MPLKLVAVTFSIWRVSFRRYSEIASCCLGMSEARKTVAVIGPGRPIESQRLVPFVLFAYETENVRVILQRCTCFSYDGIPIRASLIGFEEMERGACRWHETETPPHVSVW